MVGVIWEGSQLHLEWVKEGYGLLIGAWGVSQPHLKWVKEGHGLLTHAPNPQGCLDSRGGFQWWG